MALRDFLKRNREKKQTFRAMQDQDRMGNTIVERKKSANERELNRFIEEDREEQIKVDLEKFRARQRADMFNSNILNAPTVFDHRATIMKSDSPLKGKENNGMFMGKSNMFSRGNMLDKGNMMGKSTMMGKSSMAGKSTMMNKPSSMASSNSNIGGKSNLLDKSNMMARSNMLDKSNMFMR